MISQYLVPRDKCQETRDKHYGPAPSTLKLERNGQVLYYFGSNHSHDPTNKQYPLLKDLWKEFLNKTDDQDRLVLIEGGLRPVADSEVAAIHQGVEGGLITLLATKEGLDLQSPDIPVNSLIGEYPQGQRSIADLYWFLINLNSYLNRPNPKPNFEGWFAQWYRYSHQTIRGGFHSSLDDLKATYKETIGKEFDLEESPDPLINPNNTNTPINSISQELSDLRDTKIINEIEKLWKEGKSLFIVFGQGHLIIQEPALRKLTA